MDLVDLCASGDVTDGEIRRGQLPSGHAVAIYCVSGEYFVTDDICSHGDASLSEDGSLDGYEVECSWHFGRFDVRSGAPCAMPCEHALRSWPVKIENGRVFVDAGAHSL
ncbi:MULTISPECIES: non-heme iron oxygenase ferredoxin subunit [unclassified Paraburkholderia]|uniref:non-heme iron oxygenase ferredoxin subunit n=1 Tax=unclassified Paraburkholderia TaxID=2615204 RepID=UPI002AB2177B|nr:MULTISPECIES: non-heme iron oxygenase ferredoxin subunit [unclassified Paraburkholderia]